MKGKQKKKGHSMYAQVLTPINDPTQSAKDVLRNGARKIFRLLLPEKKVELRWTESGDLTSQKANGQCSNEHILREVEVDDSLVQDFLQPTTSIQSQTRKTLGVFEEEVEIILCPKSC